VLTKTQWNRALLFRTHFKMIRRSEIHIGLKVDDNTGVGFFSVTYIICVNKSEDNMLGSAQAPTTYGM
jgi:hypothetical protein